jgi:hypothetical protein
VDDRGGRGGAPFALSLQLWRDIPGGKYADGSVVTEPAELKQARWLLTVCERFGALPSAVEAEDAALIRLLAIERLGTREEENPDGG